MRLAVASLLCALVLSGCFSSDDTEGDAPAGAPAESDGPTSGTGGPLPSSTAAPAGNVRVESLPTPTIIEGALVLGLASNTTSLVLLAADVAWDLDDFSASGGADDETWVMVFERNATVEANATCHPMPEFRFWSSFLDGGGFNWFDIPAGEYLLLVHAPTSSDVRVGLNGGDFDDDNATQPALLSVSYATTYFDPDVTAAGDAPHAASFSLDVPGAGPALFFGVFENRATLQHPDASAALRLAGPDGEACADTGAVGAQGVTPGRTAIDLAAESVLVANGTHVFSGEMTTGLSINPSHDVRAALLQYTGPWANRPFWS